MPLFNPLTQLALAGHQLTADPLNPNENTKHPVAKNGIPAAPSTSPNTPKSEQDADSAAHFQEIVNQPSDAKFGFDKPDQHTEDMKLIFSPRPPDLPAPEASSETESSSEMEPETGRFFSKIQRVFSNVFGQEPIADEPNGHGLSRRLAGMVSTINGVQ